MHEILHEVETLLAGMEKAGKHCRLVSSTGLEREENPFTGMITLSFAVTYDVNPGPEPQEKMDEVNDAPADTE